MKRVFMFLAVVLFISPCCLGKAACMEDTSAVSSLTITIVYDNVASDAAFKPDWGFACFVEGIEKPTLFDTGTQPNILMHNMKLARVDPDKIECLVISHVHGDHTGGLAGVVGGKHLKAIYLPEELAPQQIRLLELAKLEKSIVLSPLEIMPRVHLTGAMGDRLIEQSMIIDTKQGLVIITGCSHPGIVSILRKAKEILHKDIYLVLGGFHLIDHTDAQVKEIIGSFKTIGVRYCGASHCTGEKAIAAFREAYGDRFVELGVGRKIVVGRDGVLVKQ
jgi:7,8-dihydropterin-6-yl-methyl-4-(beta-D-ribofuranosyl)aminobenzene 5'-phosphate synthase